MSFWNIEVEAQTSWTQRFGCHLQLQIATIFVDSKFSEPKTHPCSSNGVFHQCNFTSTQSAAVQQQPEKKTKGGLKSHHIGPKITEEKT